jgi:glycosyltransferase involved in cell wall biosynthesis
MSQPDAMVEGLVSTVIPVYNRSAMLRESVASVLAQTHRAIEVIISDDGSIDDTPMVAQALVEAHPETVRYVRNHNRGPGPAREAGRLLARGEFVQYLDSDDRLMPAKFELQVAALRANPDCGIAYGMTRLVDESGKQLAAPFKWTGERRMGLFPGLLVDRWWCTHTPLYRRETTDAIGPWSDLRYSQDWDYDARAGAMSVRLAYCPDYVSEHRHHAGARQTGGGKWLLPADRVRFFRTLHDCAQRAGVSAQAPEMRHFARWAFAHARQCGALGDAASAEALCALAAKARGDAGLDMRAYRALAKLLGWSAAQRLGEGAMALLGRSSGTDTRRQSWMP